MRRLAIMLAIAGAGGCRGTSSTNAENVIEEANRSLNEAQAAADNALRGAASAENSAVPPSRQTAWVYDSRSNPMDDRRTEFACVRSTNTVQLGFPYGSPYGRLCLRNSPQHGRDAYVELDGEGQILCYSYRNCTIRVRFDDEQARNFSAVGASDNSTNIVFIEGRDRFERALRDADRTAIEIEFYRAGQQAFTFPTAGFEWRGRTN